MTDTNKLTEFVQEIPSDKWDDNQWEQLGIEVFEPKVGAITTRAKFPQGWKFRSVCKHCRIYFDPTGHQRISCYIKRNRCEDVGITTFLTDAESNYKYRTGED